MNPYRLTAVLPPSRWLIHPLVRVGRALAVRWEVARTGPAITPAQWEALLRSSGFQTGAVIFLHVSWNEVMRWAPWADPLAVIRQMQELLGESGTLLMPTFPFRGRELDFAAGHPVFDPQRTPSQVGWLTEIFRRMPGVIRSCHPTHPVAGWGPQARRLLDEHHLGATYGPTSPFQRLREVAGLVVGLGTDMEPFTIQYAAEALHPRYGRMVFAAEPQTLWIRVGSEQLAYPLHVTRVRRDYRRMERFGQIFLEEGLARRQRAKGLFVTVVRAEDFLNRYLRLMDEGLLLFHPEE